MTAVPWADQEALHLKALGRQITELRQNAAMAEIGMEQAEREGWLTAYDAAKRIRDDAAANLERLEVAEAAARAALPPLAPARHCVHCHARGDLVGDHCRDVVACNRRYQARRLVQRGR